MLTNTLRSLISAARRQARALRGLLDAGLASGPVLAVRNSTAAQVASGLARDTARWMRFEPSPRRIRVVSAVSIGTALVAVIFGLAVGPQAPPAGSHPNVALSVTGAFITMIVAHVARLRLRYGAGEAMITWGESALLIMLYVVPMAWVPAVTFAGCLIAGTVYGWRDSTGTPAQVIRSASNICVSATAAGLVASAAGPPYRAGFSAALVLTLFLSAGVYFAGITHLTALTVAARDRTSFQPVVTGIISGKLIMSVGNVCVGLLVVAVLGVDFRWLVLLPPVLWLLHQGYAYQLSGRDERRAWEVFAQAARALNQLDEPAVASAGLRAAIALFGAERVELLVRQQDGALRRYDGAAEDAKPAAPGGPPRGLDRFRRRHQVRETVRALTVGGHQVGELRMRVPARPDLKLREQMSLSAYADALAAALHDAASYRQLAAISERTTHEAAHDQLTGLMNRSAFQARGEVMLRDAPAGEPVTLLLLDIDNFRDVNDTLGHLAGDQLLQIVAARLRTAAEPGELLARLGGDEFAVLVGGDAGPLIARQREAGGRVVPHHARRLAELISLPAEVGGVHLAVEASIGAVTAAAGEVDLTELLRRADTALYQAKRDGSSVSWYDPATDDGSTDRLALLAELREALGVTDQIVFHAQPVVELATGAPGSVEVLVRWRHPRRGLLEPAAFLDVVEGSEMVAPFTRYVVDNALRLAAEWAAQGIVLPVSVNISPRGLLGHQLPDQVSQLLSARGVPAERLTLEITETVVAPDRIATTAALGVLRAQGVRLAVDDFGSGYSSLTFLTQVPVDEIKIDRAFVQRMLEKPESAAIVRTTVELGRQLNLRVVADGVSTAEQATALARMGVTAAQGDHFFAPVPTDELVAALRPSRVG